MLKQKYMAKNIFIGFSLLILFGFIYNRFTRIPMTGAPPYGEEEENVPETNVLGWLKGWKRPKGQARVGLQVGHYKNNEFPDELEHLRNNGGATGGGKKEWEVNYAIAQETAKILKENNIEVDILPATIPPSYWADAFIAIHADGSTDRTKSGFKIAGPWRDLTGDSEKLINFITDSYYEIVGMKWDDNITSNMRGYYAFSWWRHEHAIHPMTTAAIVETGFLTNPNDQLILINTPQIPAKAIAQGIIKYLQSEKLI